MNAKCWQDNSTLAQFWQDYKLVQLLRSLIWQYVPKFKMCKPAILNSGNILEVSNKKTSIQIYISNDFHYTIIFNNEKTENWLSIGDGQINSNYIKW